MGKLTEFRGRSLGERFVYMYVAIIPWLPVDNYNTFPD